MDFERYNTREKVATCGLSGLRIEPGDAVRLVILDYDYSTNVGPHFAAAAMTAPAKAIYTGGGEVLLSQDPEQAAANSVFSTHSGISHGTHQCYEDSDRTDRWVYLVSEKIWSGLGEITDNGKPITKLADERFNAMFAAMREFTSSEVADREADGDAISSVWTEDFDCVGREYPELWERCDEFSGSEDDLKQLLAVERDSYLLWLATSLTGRPFVPSLQVSWSADDNAVGELARLVRRKAMAAAMAS